MGLTLAEIKEFLEANKETAEVKDYLKTLQGETVLEAGKVSEFLENSDEGRKIKDSLNTKFLEAYRENGLKKELAKTDEIWQAKLKEELEKQRLELNPRESEEQKKIRELQEQLNGFQSTVAQKELEILTGKLLAENNLPANFLNYLQGSDVETTQQRVADFKKLWSESIQADVEKRFAEAGPRPKPTAQVLKAGELYSMEQIKSMTPAEIAANHDKVMESFTKLNKK